MNNLAREIKKLIEKDQSVINLYKLGKISKQDWMVRSNLISRSFLSLLDEYGFPYYNQYPDEIYTAGITMFLHLDLSDMRCMYEKYIKGTNPDLILNKHRVILVDKILVLSGKLQLYGSQYKISPQGEVILIPVEDQSNLNNRRLELELEPIEEYFKSIGF